MQGSSSESAPVANDYLSNLDVVERFPFSLYHKPIRNHVLRLVAAESQRKGKIQILNVGCGLSQVLRHLKGDYDYLGVDVDERAVAICRNRFPGSSFEVSGGYELPVESASRDVVFATEVVEHVLEPERWLAEVVRTLRPGGVVQLSTPNYGGWLLPLIEKTFLEWMARRQGFTRVGLHPTPFDSKRLRELLLGAGLVEVEVRKTPGHLALIGSGRKPHA